MDGIAKGHLTVMWNRLFKKALDDNCDYFFNTDRRYNYGLVKQDGNFYLFPMPGMKTIETIGTKIESIINEPNIIKNLRELGIKYFNKCGKDNEMDLTTAQEKLAELNKTLQNKCPELSLNLNYTYNLTGDISSYSNVPEFLILCLYSGNNCVSSIQIIPKKASKTVEIRSRTDKNYEGKKYNKLLRSVVIILSSLLNIHEIHSAAENIISALLLLKYFNAEIKEEGNDDFFEFLESKNTTIEMTDWEALEKILQEYKTEKEKREEMFELEIALYINKPNIEKAQKQFEKTIEDFSC